MPPFIVMESTYTIEGGNAVVILFSRDYADVSNSCTHKFYNFEPYFWAPADEAHRVVSHYLVKRVETDVQLDAKGRNIRKVVTHLPSDVPKVRDATDDKGNRLLSWTDMADFVFDKRFLVDKHIKYAYEIMDGEPIPVDVPSPITPRIVFFDIEIANPPTDFPEPKAAAFPITTIQVMDILKGTSIVFTSDIVEQVDDAAHIICGSEQDLIKSFCKYCGAIDPDILTGWNTEQFDIPYILNRASSIHASTKGLSRIGNSSMEYDTREGKYKVRVRGRATLDMLEAFKKYNIGMGQRESFSLKSVIADHELLDVYDSEGNVVKKYAFEYPDLGVMMQQIINEKRFPELIQYCKNDVVALQNINESLGLFDYFESIRFIAGSKISDSLYNSKIIEMLLLHEGIRPMPTKQYGGQVEEKFEGALVITPKMGIYEYILTVDVSSMYPNIMIGFNISADIDGVTVRAMKRIMELRERYRTMQKNGIKGGEALNSGTKTISNSFYGVLGSPAFRLYNRDNALFVTTTGQEINRYIQKCAGELNLNTIYGDSVGNTTEVKIYRSNGEWFYTTIEKLFTQVDFERGDKEYCNLNDCYVESINDDGKIILDKVTYVMRHRCNKQMYNVRLTTDWSIDVTEDHSLFVYLTKAILPKADQKYRIGSCLTSELGNNKLKSVIIRRSSLHTQIDSLNKDIKFYEYLGYHAGNGTLRYNAAHNNKAFYGGISFGSDVDVLHDYFIPYMKDNGYFTNLYYDKRGGAHVGDITYSGIDFVRFIEAHIGHSHNKHVPDFMFCETPDNIRAFIRGYFTADGTVMIRNGLPIVRLTSINSGLINDVQKLLYMVDIPSSRFTEGTPNSYNGKSSGTYSIHLIVADIKKFRNEIGFITERKQCKMSNCNDYKVRDDLDWGYSSAVTKSEIDYDNYVYDLHCTNTHRYFANNILVHNTDSCFISPITNANDAYKIESHLNSKLKEWCKEKGCIVDITLKAEKLFRRILFKAASSNRNKSSKKKYAGYLIWKEGKDKDELSFMGLELKRSDQSDITKRCLNQFLNTALINGNTELATENVRELYNLIQSGNASIYDISIPKAIRKVGYNTKNSWVNGINYAKQHFNYYIGEGAKPRLIYLKHDQTICIDEDFDTSQIVHLIDWQKMADVCIRKKMESYLWSLNMEWNTMIDGQQPLNKWF